MGTSLEDGLTKPTDRPASRPRNQTDTEHPTKKEQLVTRTSKSLTAAAALTGLLALGACSSAGGSGAHEMPGGSMAGSMTGMPSAASSATRTQGQTIPAHNQADVTFASSMVPHHQQAVEMAELALSRGAGTDVRQLAAQIKAAQGPEIATMTAWLKAWGSAPMPPAHDMGGMGMDGMMTAQQMADLDAASGTAFDRMWLQMMVEHHQGAVVMARTELAQGQDAPAKALARAVIAGQTKEIATMKGLLADL